MAAPLGGDGHAQSGQAAADDQYIGVDDVHLVSFSQDGHQAGGAACGGVCSQAGV